VGFGWAAVNKQSNGSLKRTSPPFLLMAKASAVTCIGKKTMQGVVLVSVSSAVLHHNHTAAELMHDAACRCTVPIYLRIMSEVIKKD